MKYIALILLLMSSAISSDLHYEKLMCMQSADNKPYLPNIQKSKSYIELPKLVVSTLSNVQQEKMYVVYKYKQQKNWKHEIAILDLKDDSWKITGLYQKIEAYLDKDKRDYLFAIQAYDNGVVIAFIPMMNYVNALNGANDYLVYSNYVKLFLVQNDGAIYSKQLNLGQIRGMKVTDDFIFLFNFDEIYRVNMHNLSQVDVIAASAKGHISGLAVSEPLITVGMSNTNKGHQLIMMDNNTLETINAYPTIGKFVPLQLGYISNYLYKVTQEVKDELWLDSFDVDVSQSSHVKSMKYALDEAVFPFRINNFEMVNQNLFIADNMKCLIKITADQ